MYYVCGCHADSLTCVFIVLQDVVDIAERRVQFPSVGQEGVTGVVLNNTIPGEHTHRQAKSEELMRHSPHTVTLSCFYADSSLVPKIWSKVWE